VPRLHARKNRLFSPHCPRREGGRPPGHRPSPPRRLRRAGITVRRPPPVSRIGQPLLDRHSSAAAVLLPLVTGDDTAEGSPTRRRYVLAMRLLASGPEQPWRWRIRQRVVRPPGGPCLTCSASLNDYTPPRPSRAAAGGRDRGRPGHRRAHSGTPPALVPRSGRCRKVLPRNRTLWLLRSHVEQALVTSRQVAAAVLVFRGRRGLIVLGQKLTESILWRRFDQARDCEHRNLRGDRRAPTGLPRNIRPRRLARTATGAAHAPGVTAKRLYHASASISAV